MKRQRGGGSVDRQAPGAFSPPAPGAFLWPAFLRPEADTPSVPTPEVEATEGGRKLHNDRLGKIKIEREGRTMEDSDYHPALQWVINAFNESVRKNCDETTWERFIQAKFLWFRMRVEWFGLLQRLLTGTNYSAGGVLLHAWKEKHRERNAKQWVV